MRDEYDFSKAIRNPWKVKPQVKRVRLDEQTAAYFEEEAQRSGIPFDKLVNLYLKDCAEKKKKIKVSWE